MDLWSGLNARLRTAITLSFLLVLLLAGVAWGFGQLLAPLPVRSDPPICVPTDYVAGDTLMPSDVTVSVLNAGERQGLAVRTMQLFVDQGFAQGQIGNAPADTSVDRAEIWTDQPNDPAAKLLRSRLGPVTVRPESISPVVGITVVVGDEFTVLAAGAGSVTLRRDATICSPPIP